MQADSFLSMSTHEATREAAASTLGRPLLRVRAIITPELAINPLLFFLSNADDVHPRLVVLELIRELEEIWHRDGDKNLASELVPHLPLHRDVQIGIESSSDSL